MLEDHLRESRPKLLPCVTIVGKKGYQELMFWCVQKESKKKKKTNDVHGQWSNDIQTIHRRFLSLIIPNSVKGFP